MGLVNKLKNILFEEEEVEIPVIEKKEKIVTEPITRDMPRKEEIKQTTDYSSFYNEEQSLKPTNNTRRVVEPPRISEKLETDVDSVSEREIFRSEKTFNFPAFDEKEFESSMPRRTTNVLEHERKKLKKETQRKVPEVKKEEPIKNKFRPSPIISPVYGILDKNYTPDDITTREAILKPLDVDSVRRKAFGTLEDDIMDVPKITDEDNDSDIREEKLEKARTIDELLKDSSDEEIVVNDSFKENSYNDFSRLEDTITDLRKEFGDKLDEGLDKTIESLDEEIIPKKEQEAKEDTLESDLFDLIDSMYENREGGE